MYFTIYEILIGTLSQLKCPVQRVFHQITNKTTKQNELAVVEMCKNKDIQVFYLWKSIKIIVKGKYE